MMRSPNHWTLVLTVLVTVSGCRSDVGQPPATPFVVPSRDSLDSTRSEIDAPEPPVLVSWDFTAGNEAYGWRNTHDLGIFSFDEEGLHTVSVGGDPYMLGPETEIDAAQAYYVEVRMRSTAGSDAQIFWITEQSGRYDEAKSLHFPAKGDGRWRTYQIPVHDNPAWTGTIRELRIDPTVQQSSEIALAWIRVLGPKPGAIEAMTFGPSRAIVDDNAAFEIRAELRNGGDTAAQDVRVALVLPDELSLVSGDREIIYGTVTSDDADVELATWQVSGPPGIYVVSLALDARIIGQAFVVIGAAEVSGEVTEIGDDYLRLGFPEQPFGYGVVDVSVREGDTWRRVGRTRGLGTLVYRTADGGVYQTMLVAETLESTESSVVIPFSFSDSDGAVWTGRMSYSLCEDGRAVEVDAQLYADADVQVLNWTPLALYVGDGSFGRAKSSAIFPGIEFLLDDEESSGTDFISPPNHKRYIPHPYKVTVPVMAITNEGTSVGITWDPLQQWDGVHQYPGVLLAVPNTWDGQDNQLMALFAPGPVDHEEENQLRSSSPYQLEKGQALHLSARVFATPANGALSPLAFWLRSYGLPDLPPLARSYTDAIQLSLESTTGPTWDDVKSGWHYALPDPWGPGSSPANELHLWLATLRGDFTDAQSAEYGALVRELSSRTDYAGGQPNPLLYLTALSMHLADNDDLLNTADLARARLSGQNPEGFWPYVPQSQSGRPFGEAGDTSSGQIAANALYLLRFARITGDAGLRDAGLRALAYMEEHHSRRPEGAQIWELPLHCPDLLAAAWAEQSYLEAYRLTGEARYVEQAQRWAISGLPFIYLWSATDRSVMAYSSVPVFAATNYTYPWLGRPVMWNGLDYAFGLWELNAALDKAGVEATADWQQVAEGIVRAAMQMQPASGEYLGMYPDAWDVVSGGEAYSWWLHPFYILHNLYLMEGAGAEVRTVILRDSAEAVHINAVADIVRAERVNGGIEVELGYYAGETCALMINQLPRAPAEVRVDGRPLDVMVSLADHTSGWLYRDGVLLIKVPFADALAHVLVRDG